MIAIEVPGSDGITMRGIEWRPTGDIGATFLLLHGLASNARLWDGVGAELVKLGHRAIALDLRGHGRSDKPDEGYDFATVTSDVIAAIDALQIDRPVVVGQSWGGNVVIDLAVRAPDRIAAICAVDGGIIELAEHFDDFDACWSQLRPPALAGIPLVRLDAGFRAAHPDWPESGITGALACFWVDDEGNATPWLTIERHRLILESLFAHRPSTLFAELRVPTLMLCALGAEASWTRDKEAAAKRAAASPFVAVRWMRGDHDLHAQHPAAVAEHLHHLAEGLR